MKKTRIILLAIVIAVFCQCGKDDLKPIDTEITDSSHYMLYAIIDNDTLRNNTFLRHSDSKEFNAGSFPSVVVKTDISVSPGEYIDSIINFNSKFLLCFNFENDNGGITNICTNSNSTGTIEVTEVRNDSIWVYFDIVMELDPIMTNITESKRIKGYLNGMPLK